MSTPILATKLFAPRPRPTSVQRPRLIRRLEDGMHRKMTLISAPAGSGKTTLVSEWLTASQMPAARQVAWLSLDESDSDPTRLLTYLVAAIRSVAPTLGEGILASLQSGQLPPVEAMLAALLNEVAALADRFVLVLDDYHLLDAKAVGDALTFLVEHLPPQMHVVIATREDPRLPLARLRARDQLTELRGADLRFTAAEAAGFLQAMNLDLSAEDVAALEGRTEGWIAGLQLAALSMQGQQDVSSFIRAFAGDHRYIVDYLVEEVLQHQPEPVRNFLLQTAILDALNGSLCDAVTGQVEGKAQLEALERGNFFVVPLDEKRQWYRYHRLFADVLHVHLLAEQPDHVATLHGRASEWYEQHGSPAHAIRHALAAQDFARAADLVEVAVPVMSRSRQEATLLGWLKAIPDELIRDRPVLSVAYVGALLSNGIIEGVETHLQNAERWLDTTGEGSRARVTPDATVDVTPAIMPVVTDQAAFRRLPYMVAVYRAGHALALGKLADTVNHARHALELVPAEEQLWYGAAAALLGLAYWTDGDLETAYQSYAAGMASLQQAGHITDTIGGAIALADIRIVQGHLRQAMHIYERGLQMAAAQGEPLLRGAADMHVGLSDLCRERGDLAAAAQHLAQSKELGDHKGFPQNPYRWRVAMARIHAAQGDLAGALDLLHAAERIYVSDFYPNVHPIAAWRARVWLAQGQWSEALNWVQEQALSAHDDLSYVREFEHITLARVGLSCYQHRQAGPSLPDTMGLLDRLLHAAETGGRMGSVIEILVIQALAHHAQGDGAAALESLQRALALAEPEGYCRIFVDEGLPMVQLLRAAAAQRISPAYAAELLAAVEAEQPARETTRATASTSQPLIQPLIDPLSERELEVLRLFATELSGPEIAEHLVVALSTIRTHTKGIYSKLNVNSRREAVKRAEELALI